MKVRYDTVTILLGILTPCVAQGIVITDNDFGPHWSSAHVSVGVGSDTFGGATNLATGGNPDAYRRSSHLHGGSSPNDVLSWFFNFDTSFVLDPSIGPLNEVSFEFDGIIYSSLSGSAQFGPAIRQGGRLFHFDPMASGFGHPVWTPYAFNSLTESHFAPSEPAFPTASVDFSSTGSPMEFGYWSLTGGFLTASAETGADNWRLEVNTGPFPGDFNGDGKVDGFDFLEWQRGFGTLYNATHLASPVRATKCEYLRPVC